MGNLIISLAGCTDDIPIVDFTGRTRGQVIQSLSAVIDERQRLVEESTKWAEDTLAAQLPRINELAGAVKAHIADALPGCTEDAEQAMDKVAQGGDWTEQANQALQDGFAVEQAAFVDYVYAMVGEVDQTLTQEQDRMQVDLNVAETELYDDMIEQNSESREALGEARGKFNALGESTSDASDQLTERVRDLVQDVAATRAGAANIRVSTVAALDTYIEQQLNARDRGDFRSPIWTGGCGASEKQSGAWRIYCLTREAEWSHMPSWYGSVNGPEGKFIFQKAGVWRYVGRIWTHGRESMVQVKVNGAQRYTGQDRRGNGPNCERSAWGSFGWDYARAFNSGDYIQAYVKGGDCSSFSWAGYNPVDGKTVVQVQWLGQM